MEQLDNTGGLMDIQALKTELGELVVKEGTYIFANTGLDHYKLTKHTANQVMDFLCDNKDDYMFYLLIRACQVYCIRLIHNIHYASQIPLEDINQEMAIHVSYVLESWRKRRNTESPIKNSLQYVAYRLRDVNRSRYDKDYNILGQDKLQYRMDYAENEILNIGTLNDENENEVLYDYILKNYGYNKTFIMFNKNLGRMKSITGLDLSNKEMEDTTGLSATEIKNLTREIKDQLRVDSKFIEMLKGL